MYQVSFGKNMTRGRRNTEVLGRKTGCFLLIGNHIKPPEEHTLPPLRCFAYRKESECVCNLIITDPGADPLSNSFSSGKFQTRGEKS